MKLSSLLQIFWPFSGGVATPSTTTVVERLSIVGTSATRISVAGSDPARITLTGNA